MRIANDNTIQSVVRAGSSSISFTLIQGYVNQHSNLTLDQSIDLLDFANNLDEAGIWGKLVWFYPFVGSTSDDLRLNLKAPDSNGLYNRISSNISSIANTNRLKGTGSSFSFNSQDQGGEVNWSDYTCFGSMNTPGQINDRILNQDSGADRIYKPTSASIRYRSGGGSDITFGGQDNDFIAVATRKNGTQLRFLVDGTIQGGTAGATIVTGVPNTRISNANCFFRSWGITSEALSDSEMQTVYTELLDLDLKIGR